MNFTYFRIVSSQALDLPFGLTETRRGLGAAVLHGAGAELLDRGLVGPQGHAGVDQAAQPEGQVGEETVGLRQGEQLGWHGGCLLAGC